MSAKVSIYEVCSSIERSVAKLTDQICSTGGKAIIYSAIEERLASLDSSLWTLGRDSFIPHDYAESEIAEHTPILLTSNLETAKNVRKTVILIDAENITEFFENKEKIASFTHVENPEIAQIESALASYPDLAVWAEDKSGKWMRKNILSD